MNIGQLIRHRREELSLSQEELAKRMGYKTRNAIYQYEQRDNMKLSLIEKFAKALETTPAYLMGWTDEPITLEIEEQEDDRLNNLMQVYANKEFIDKYHELPQDYKDIINRQIISVYEAWELTKGV